MHVFDQRQYQSRDTNNASMQNAEALREIDDAALIVRPLCREPRRGISNGLLSALAHF